MRCVNIIVLDLGIRQLTYLLFVKYFFITVMVFPVLVYKVFKVNSLVQVYSYH